MIKPIIVEIEKLTINCITHETFYDGKKVNLINIAQYLLEILAQTNGLTSFRKIKNIRGFYGGPAAYIDILRHKLSRISGGKKFIKGSWKGYKLCHPDLIKNNM